MITNKIEAKELRIGNLVKHTDKDGNTSVITIDSIHERGINVYADNLHDNSFIQEEYSYDEISAITITKEHLIKFGWGESDEGEYCNNTALINADISYDVNVRQFALALCMDELSFKMEYLHELQNTFHGITGQ